MFEYFQKKIGQVEGAKYCDQLSPCLSVCLHSKTTEWDKKLAHISTVYRIFMEPFKTKSCGFNKMFRDDVELKIRMSFLPSGKIFIVN